MWRLTALWLLIVLCVAEDDCELERIEESEAVALNTQLLQQKLHLVAGDEVVPPAERFSLPVARAFAALSQAAFCGADETLRNWTCDACHAVGFTLAPGTTRLVRQAELGEADSTFIFAARLRSMPQGGHPWPPARQKEAVKNTMQDCWSHCGSRGGFCDWCGVGNACCRQGEAGDPAECFNASSFSGTEQHECVQVQVPAPQVPLQHASEDCWIYCGKAGGFCDWCGGGNACCKDGHDSDPIECRGALNASHKKHHICTSLSPSVPPPTADDFGCVISIRGSKTFTNALHDAFFWSDELPHEDCDGCQVFDGFWRVWSGIESKVERVLIDNGCIPGTPTGTILITGHSLGAAVATLAMYMLQLRGYSVGLSYNFESPRVGNDAFHDAFAKIFNRSVSLYRITRARDPVVHVPPLPIYHHVGSEVYFKGDSSTDFVVCMDSEDPKCADRYSLLQTVIFGYDHCKSELATDSSSNRWGIGICQCII